MDGWMDGWINIWLLQIGYLRDKTTDELRFVLGKKERWEALTC